MENVYRGKRVLVTGGAGVIGTELIRKLLAFGVNVMCADLKPRPKSFPVDVNYVQGDANHLTPSQIASFGPQMLFHLATTERSVETEDFWDENYIHNLKLSHHIMTLMKQAPNLQKVVFASSYLIYDPSLYMFEGPQDEPRVLVEDTPIYPRNICGAAKLLHELELRFLTSFPSASYSAISARIYRVYGKSSRDIVSRWVRALVQDPQATLTVFGEEAMFDYIYAGDVAQGLLHLGASRASGITNLGRGQARRVSELLAILKAQFPRMKIERIPSTIPYEAHQADMRRFESLTGWRPPTDLETGVGILIEHERRVVNEAEADVGPANVLISSVARKVPLVKAYREALAALAIEGSIWGGDLDPNCVARHFCDHFWAMPRLDALDPETLTAFCREHGIRLIVPTRDKELVYFATHAARLAEAGIYVLLGEEDGIRACLDKLDFCTRCEAAGLPVIPTTATLEELSNPSGRYVVKERYGAGSRSLGLDLDAQAAAAHAAQLDEPIFQPYIPGCEYSIDLYVNRQGQVMEVVPRVRSLVVGGESVVTETREHPALVAASIALAGHFKLRGHAVLQAMVVGDEFLFIECNPRVGGASRLSFEAGLLTPRWSLLESLGEHLTPTLGGYERNLKMLRYAADAFVRENRTK